MKPKVISKPVLQTLSKLKPEVKQVWKPKSVVSEGSSSSSFSIDYSKGNWIDIPILDDLGRPMIIKGWVALSN